VSAEVTFLLFSFNSAEKRGTFRTQENNNHKPYGNIITLFGYMLLDALLWFCELPLRRSFSFLPSSALWNAETQWRMSFNFDTQR
jgi:hypothetical protein